MGVDMGCVNATLGQDVNPHGVKLELLITQIKLEIFGKSRDMLIEHFHHIFKNRKTPTKIIERSVACVTGKIILLAPSLPRIIIFGNRKAGVFKLGRVNSWRKLREIGAVKAGYE